MTTVPANPFRPTFGAPPLVWSGRTEALTSYESAISAANSPFRHLIISGNRGIGKTTLLYELCDIARKHGWIVLEVTSAPGMLRELIESTIPAAIENLDPPTLASQLTKLSNLLQPHGTGIVISIDEIQDVDPLEIRTVAAAIQQLVGASRDVSLLVAGLEYGVDALLTNPGTTFLRRAKRYTLGPLTNDDSMSLLTQTANQEGLEFTDDAATYATALSYGYPYLLQFIGYLAFELAAGDNSGTQITRDHVEAVKERAISMMGQQIHAPEMRTLSPSELAFVKAASRVSDETGSSSISDIATELGKPTTSLSRVRGELIHRGVIEQSGHGTISFSLPYLREYLLQSGVKPGYLQ